MPPQHNISVIIFVSSEQVQSWSQQDARQRRAISVSSEQLHACSHETRQRRAISASIEQLHSCSLGQRKAESHTT